jgi:hypothetical protein
LDSTVIDLCATLFDWAKFRRTKGAVKLHCLLDHDGYFPSVVVITEGKRHDVRVARTLRFDAGTVVVMDRGYVDYAWFGQLTTQEVFFVTRLKDNAVYRVVERRRVPERSAILRDEIIQLTGVAAATHCPHPLRRVEVDDPDKHGTLVFLTNHLDFGATTIAAIYKDRWQVELFFKALKQNLKIKTFVGTSQCPEGPSLDGADRHPAPQVPPVAVPLRVVAGELGRPAADEPLHASGAVGVARSAGVGSWLIGTAEPGNLISALARSVQ